MLRCLALDRELTDHSLSLSLLTNIVLDLLSFLFCVVCCCKCYCCLHYLSYLLLSCFCVEKGRLICHRREKFFSDSIRKTEMSLSSTSSLYPVLLYRTIHLKHGKLMNPLGQNYFTLVCKPNAQALVLLRFESFNRLCHLTGHDSRYLAVNILAVQL